MCSDEELPEEGNIPKLNKSLKNSVFAQNIKLISRCLKRGAQATIRVNKDAGNLLHHNRDPCIAALLISKGARVDARNRFRLTPLFLAVREGNYELVKVLLEHGANTHCFDKKEKNTPLNIAVLGGDLRIVKLLLQYGSAVNDQSNFFSNTPLHLAVSVRQINVQVISLLLEKGADVNILNSVKESPIHLAAKNDCPLFVIKKLIKYGAFINLKDNEGCSPLEYALDNDNYETTKLLLKHGADLLSYNLNGFNALHSYIYSESPKLKIVKSLLKQSCTSDTFKGCYANTLTAEGLSPLILTLYNLSYIDICIIKELLCYGADALLTIADKRGKITMFEKALLIAERYETGGELLESYESIRNFKKKKEITQQVMKWLIKYSAIKSEDNVFFMQNKLKDKHSFCNFLNECLVELPLIEQELGISLNELFKPSSLKVALPIQIQDHIIQIYATDSFPIYREVVTARLKRSDLLHKLKCELFCIDTEEGRTYALNWTVTCHLVKYLRNQDILNLFVAFFHKHDKYFVVLNTRTNRQIS